MTPTVVYQGAFLRFLNQDGWEYVERSNCTGIVLVLAVTKEGKLLLTEQFRIPIGRSVIEFPAGLIGDEEAHHLEGIEVAARRELLEETGYDTARVIPLVSGPTSAGLSSEIVSLVQAVGLTKRFLGGRSCEGIPVKEVPLGQVDDWLGRMRDAGKLVDPKVYAGLYLMKARAGLVPPVSPCM